MEDGQIIALYQARDERAIAETMDKYGAYCTTVARNILADLQDAEECVNDTYLAAWNRIPPDLPACLRAYLGRITRNLAVSRFRDNTRRKRGGGEVPAALDELAECVSDGTDIEAEYREKELAEAVGRFLRGLPVRDCDIFLARYYFLYKAADIAARVGLRENYVRTVLSRTREKLRTYLEKEKLL
ncbi:MAG: RNA polymerase sigma factor [Clostridia bacterium]|nr:RNA polymerase sigma factor [Clostridia bacterium]